MPIKFQNEKASHLIVPPSNLRPTVLLIDSGVGGLSIYSEIQRLLPVLHYIYVFDNVAFPYGEKSEIFIIKRIVEIISAVQKRYPLSLVVIACNTASTVSLPVLREEFQFPVVGVVPAIKVAARLTANGAIGLLATCGTVRCSYTRELINRFVNKHHITMLGLTELVEMAEAKLRGENICLDKLRHKFHSWLSMSEPPDTVVLGCTHFPLLRDELLQVLPKGTRLVDSGAAIAQRTAWLLEHEAPDVKSSDPNIAFCMASTEGAKQLFPVLYRYGFQTLQQLIL